MTQLALTDDDPWTAVDRARRQRVGISREQYEAQPPAERSRMPLFRESEVVQFAHRDIPPKTAA